MNHKWLTHVRHDDPLEHVTDVALRTRMQAVQGWLQRALEPHPDVEAIHQIRVSVRRMRAALEFFKPCLPRKRRRALVQALRKMRQAAGPLRDLDVLIEQLSVLPDQDSQRVTQELRQLREKAEPRLRKQLKKWKAAISDAKLDKLCDRIRWRGTTALPTWPAWAAEVLETIHRRFSQLAECRPTDSEELHKLRIQGKRLRYALELGVGAYPDIRKQLYPTMAALQEKLGAINDLAVSIDVMSDLHEQLGDHTAARHACESLVLERQTRLAATLGEIEHWWDSDPLGEFRESWYAIFPVANGGALNDGSLDGSLDGPLEGIA